MKIKIKGMILLGILYCVVYECKWLDIIGVTGSVWAVIELGLFWMMFFYCRFNQSACRKIAMYVKSIDKGVCVIFVLSIIELCYTVNSSNVQFYSAFRNLMFGYSKLLAIYPILYLLEHYGQKKIIRFLAWICGLSLICQSIIAIIYNKSGIVLNEFIISNKEWIRNGNIRIGSMPLTWVLLILMLAIWLNEKKMLYRLGVMLVSTLLVCFLVFVYQSRALYISAICAGIMMFILQKRKDRSKFLIVIFIMICLVAFTQTELFNDFIATFASGSEDDTVTGRLKLLELIRKDLSVYKVFFGYGFIGTTYEVSNQTFYFIDYGLLGDLLQLGMFSLTLYFLITIRLFKNARVLSENKGFGYSFTIGSLFFVLFGAIGFTIIPTTRNFAIPIVISISEYSRKICIINRRKIE